VSQLLTPAEVAELLQVKTGTVYAWAKQRRLPAVVLSIGKRKECLRFRQSSIDAWIADHEREASNGFTNWDRR